MADNIPTQTNHQPPGEPAPEMGRGMLPGEARMLFSVWLTYGSFYFCRANISAAVPGLKASPDENGLGFDAVRIGWILASLKIAYAMGQLVNGQLAERISPRLLLALGMFCSAGLSIAFGFGSTFTFLLCVWALNGYFQSLGWTPCVRVLTNWIPVQRRGNAIGIVGTGYQLMGAITIVIAGFAAARFGWQGALIVPGVILALAGVFMLLFLEETPRSSAASRESHGQGSRKAVRPFRETLHLTLSNPSLWLLGTSLGLLNACRYGYMDWGLAHLQEVQDTDIDKAALKIAVLPIGAILGAYLAGWATDRFFNSRRAPVICCLLLMLGLLTLAYPSIVELGVVPTIMVLLCVGFTIYGPQVLLVGTAPADLARDGTSAAAAGFVNCLGYIGAALFGDVLTGYILEHYGWQITIYVWSGCALTAALLAGWLWNAQALIPATDAAPASTGN